MLNSTRPSFSIYDASAGSGKTYTLVREYLKILLTSNRDDAYRNILAITFTNKAVHEMKSRVVTTLSAFAQDDIPEKFRSMLEDISCQTGIDESVLRQKAKKIIRHLIHNYAAFDISTIDKFTHKVIRTFAHDLNLPMTFEVSLDTENLLTEAIDALIAQAGEDRTLTKLLVDFTMEKTDDDKSWDISRELFETGKLVLNENNRTEIQHFRDKSIDDFNAVKERIREECRKMELESVMLANEALDMIRKNGIEFNSFYSSYVPKHFEKVSNGIIERKVSLYKYLDEIECKRCPAKTPQGQKDLVDQIADELWDKLKKINAIAEKYMFYNAFLKNITPLSLLNTVGQELKKIQEDQNILSIAEFNKLINEQIRDQPAPFIYERLGEKYRHFFIDEFQDTSELQWQNLIPLIDNATSSENAGEKGTLMIVGDPKQSIYRWRGGKAEQFIDLTKEHNPFNNPDKQLFSLDTNYRSFSQVIEFNNEFFKMLSAEFAHVDYTNLYANKSFQKCNAKNGGYVNISFLPEVSDDDTDKTDLYIERVVAIIAESISKGFDYRDIAILTRKRSQGICVASALTELKIPIISSETLLIGNASEVRFIINLLSFINKPRNKEAKAGFLQYLATAAQDSLPIHDFIAEGMSHELESDFERWLQNFGYGISFRGIRKKSLYEAVELIISKFLGKGRDNAYVQFFLDIVLERDVRGSSGIADFLDFWGRTAEKFSIPSPENSDAVKILTIHKSKGLEFPIVIFPFAEEEFGRKPKDKLWVRAEEDVFGIPKVLVDNNNLVEHFGEDAADLFNSKKQEALLDNINVLYVALTRAEEQLYVVSSMNLGKNGEKPSNNLCSYFIKFLESRFVFDSNVFEYGFGDPLRKSEKIMFADVSRSIESVEKMLDPSAIRISRKESLMWGTKQQDAIEYGNVIHEILSDVSTADDVEVAISKATESGHITRNDDGRVRSTIQAIIGHHELSDFFTPGRQIYNEQAIIPVSGPILKPDRMVVVGNELYLLDYKTGAHEAKHVRQLDMYQHAIEGVGYKVVKKALVYIGDELNVVNLQL